MGRIDIGGGLHLGYRVWGAGPVPVVFIHGNLASKEWFELTAPHLPRDLTVTGIDWRGCGDSDRPDPGPDYAAYSMEQHATDMLAALDALGIGRCHLATHSTGGYIAMLMELAAPERFLSILDLDPVPPTALPFDAAGTSVFEAMRAAREMTRTVLASAAPTLFSPGSLAQGMKPSFAAAASEGAALFERIVDRTFGLPAGIWLGTPHHLNRAYQSGGLTARLDELAAERLIVWGEQDLWIPEAGMDAMAASIPNARLIKAPGVGHSMNIEAPLLYAGYFSAFFSGRKPPR